MKSHEKGVRVYSSHLNLCKINGQPGSHRKKTLAALEQAKRVGYSELYDDVSMLPVIDYSKKDWMGRLAT